MFSLFGIFSRRGPVRAAVVHMLKTCIVFKILLTIYAQKNGAREICYKFTRYSLGLWHINQLVLIRKNGGIWSKLHQMLMQKFIHYWYNSKNSRAQTNFYKLSKNLEGDKLPKYSSKILLHLYPFKKSTSHAKYTKSLIWRKGHLI